MSILHQLNLDTIGGVENLFKNYIEFSRLSHKLLVSNAAIHPVLRKMIKSKIKDIAYTKYAGPFLLPRPLRAWHVQRILSRFSPSKILYWNCRRYSVNTFPKINIPYVYYDHGSAWLVKSGLSKYSTFLHNADQIIACGFSSKRMMELRWGVKQPITVISNRLRFDAFPDNLEPKKIDSNKPITLGFAGRLVSVKGAPLAIHALVLLRKSGVDARLNIAGEGRDKKSLQGLVKQLGVEKYVRFLGLVSDMRRFYQNIDFFLAPSLRDPYPLVAIEAVCWGCVPIATAVDGFPDIIESNKTGICLPASLPLSDYVGLGGDLQELPEFIYNPQSDALEAPRLVDPSAIAKTIQTFLSSPKRYEAMSSAGVDARKLRFGFDRYVQELDAALREGI